MLFSDMEGSTRLLTQLGTNAYASLLATQRRLQREAYKRWHGHEMGTEGDSFFVAFSSARNAVCACLQAQRALAEQEWPQGASVRVRMGLHTGEPEAYENGYVGMDVHLAARVAGTAYGGQVVVSDATTRLLSEHLPEGASLRSLGRHRLKDLPQEQHLHQLVAPGLEADFPPLRSLGTRTNLPRPLHPLLGRTREYAELTAFVRRRDVRLHTLTGPGGAGKTRLAVAVAETVADDYPDGVYFVPLDAVTQSSMVWTTIAEVLGLSGESKAPPTFFDHLADRRLLLVLDNLEQLSAGGADIVGELIEALPTLSVLATSRRPLHLPGEQEYTLQTLEVPPIEASVEQAQRAGAVALFVSLAQRVRSGFELTAGNVRDVIEVCQGLDGLPLALELAAARSKVLSPGALHSQLNIGLAAMGTSGRPERHQTVRATVAWSYDLLNAELKSAFRGIGVFAKGAELDAISEVLDVADPVEAVASLVDVSLARVDDRPGGTTRVRLLDLVRQFALEQVEAAGELDGLQYRHAEYYLRLAEAAAADLRGPGSLTARDRIESELGNLRQALSWALDGRDPERVTMGLRLCTALGWFWYTSGYVAEGRAWAERASALATDRQGPELASVLHSLAILLLQQGEHRSGRDILAKCLRMWRRIGDSSKVAMELNSLGVAYRNLGDSERARALLEESADVSRSIGDEGRLASALSNLGLLEIDAGRAERAIDIFTEAEAVDSARGDRWGVLVDQTNRVGALLSLGRAEEGEGLLSSMADSALALGDIDLTVNVIELYAACCAAGNDPRRAARLVAAAATLRQQAQVPLADPEAALLDRLLAPARAALTAQEWAAEGQAGHRLSAAEALQHAQAPPEGPPG